MSTVNAVSPASASRVEERGNSAVEFALLLPALLVLVFLVFEVGRVFGSWLLITNAAREGARNAAACLSSSPTRADCISPAKRQVNITAQFLTVDQNAPCTNNQIGSGSSCVKVVYCQNGANNNDSLCPQTTTTDNFYVVLVEYQLQTLMPITGQIPFFGALNYPGYIEVVGLSTVRAE